MINRICAACSWIRRPKCLKHFLAQLSWDHRIYSAIWSCSPTHRSWAGSHPCLVGRYNKAFWWIKNRKECAIRNPPLVGGMFAHDAEEIKIPVGTGEVRDRFNMGDQWWQMMTEGVGFGASVWIKLYRHTNVNASGFVSCSTRTFFLCSYSTSIGLANGHQSMFYSPCATKLYHWYLQIASEHLKILNKGELGLGIGPWNTSLQNRVEEY